MAARQYRAAECFVVALCGFGSGLLVADLNMPDAERLAQSKEALQSIQRLNTELAACFPVDLGERSIMSLYDTDGVLKLRCEKHAIVGFAETSQALPTTINVPISKD